MSEVQTLGVFGPQDKEIASVEFPTEIFGVLINIPLMHQAVAAQLATTRQDTHATKTRSMVSGDGKKSLRQKSTGNARQGSIRAPHFTGGGIVHDLQPHDHDQRIPKKMKQGALRSALSDHARNGCVHVAMALIEGETPKTKIALATLRAIVEDRQTFVVLERNDEIAVLSLRNVPKAHVPWIDQLNTYDVLDADDIVFTQAALESFLGTKEETR